MWQWHFNDRFTKFPSCRITIGLVLLLPCLVTGCGTFVAHRMIEAPNTYPSWLAPPAPVLLAFDEKLLTNSPAQICRRGSTVSAFALPRGRACGLSSEDHCDELVGSWQGAIPVHFSCRAAPDQHWTANPRGTVFLLHGYGLAEFSMVPWAWCLAQEGWRCVLVDLRGHGKSTGKKSIGDSTRRGI